MDYLPNLLICVVRAARAWGLAVGSWVGMWRAWAREALGSVGGCRNKPRAARAPVTRMYQMVTYGPHMNPNAITVTR